jgi:hypothetical protein
VASNDAVTLSIMAPSLSLAAGGRVNTIDHDEARSGWFAAARYRLGEGGAERLEWSVLWADSAAGLEPFLGGEVALARPVLLHEGSSKDAFAAGRVVALADRHARLRVEALHKDTAGDATTVYAAVSWRGTVSQVTPCTDLTYAVRVCPGNELRAAALIDDLVSRGNLRRACLRTVPVTGVELPARGGKLDAIEAIEALEGDARAIQSWVKTSLGPLPPIVRVEPGSGAGLGIRVCGG